MLTVLVALDVLTDVDRALLQIAQTPRAAWLDLTGSIVSALGQTEVLGTVAVAVAIVWLRARRVDWWLPLLMVVVVAIELALKLTIDHPGPPTELSRHVDLLPFIDIGETYAYPSGHMARTAFIVTLLRWPGWLAALAIGVMALTRVYLADHWPTDVVGGALLGYAGAALPMALVDLARRRPASTRP